MTANHDLQRRLSDFYAGVPPSRAPDWVLQAAVATIESTPQRRGLLAPWRFNAMSMSAKLGAATVAIVAVAAVAVWQLTPKPLPPGASPAASPTPTAAPTTAPSTDGTAAPTPYVPAELTQTFTSKVHGITISYPAGWTPREATEPWLTDELPIVVDPAADVLSDARFEDHLHMSLASQLLGDRSFEEWSTAIEDEGCATSELVVVDGVDGVFCNFVVLVSSGDRGYLIQLRKSDDDPELQAFDARDWFTDVLATVQLEPEKAMDAP